MNSPRPTLAGLPVADSRPLNPLLYVAKSTRKLRAHGGTARTVAPPEFPDQLVRLKHRTLARGREGPPLPT